ncbi:MAG: TCP-1/cpn60 chaperonin family protein [Candidatus Methylarchaceae archaeon HK02M1]|nr:TCP-1/cpn60 chaperonin family protein [Candidatus Methylarchaceae archaeon HK02M1]
MCAQAIPAVTQTGQPILILREGTAQTKGKDAQRNNIMAAKLVAEVIRSSLGPRGMDKMLVDSLGDVTITSDGATILKEIDIQHPSAKMMVEIAKTTDNEVGDGTTSSVVLAGALLERADELINKDVHPTTIVDGYRKAAEQALKVLDKIAVPIPADDKEWLAQIAKTSMETKMVSRESGVLANLIVDALLQVAEKVNGEYRVDIDDVKVEKKPGTSLGESMLIRGIIIDKEIVHAGMPKRIKEAKIALINAPLEVEKTEFDAKININNPEQIKMFLDEENRMLKAMVEKISDVGANIVICQKGIDDIAQHYLAKTGMMAVRRVKQSDMDKLAKATGGRVVTTLEDMNESDLGFAELVEERKIEEDRWVFIEGCKNPKAVTILIRGGTQRIVDEAERSVHDAICVTRDVMQKPAIVAGGGAPEAQIAYELQEWSHTLSGREQLAVQKFAESIEIIPLTLAENAGLDLIDTQVELRSKHGQGQKWAGIGILDGGIIDTFERRIYEPVIVKEQIIKSATEAACMILRIDDVIASSKMREPRTPPMPGGPGGGEFE